LLKTETKIEIFLKRHPSFSAKMDFRVKLIYTAAPAAFKNKTQPKSGQNRLKNNNLDSLI